MNRRRTAAHRLHRLTVIASATAGLTACTVGPDFRRPEPATPAAYIPSPNDVPGRTAATPVDAAWWESFRDPELTSLILRLARDNLDLQTAAERIEQGRARRRIAAARDCRTWRATLSTSVSTPPPMASSP